MPNFKLIGKAYPELNTQNVSDLYVRTNFQQLSNFFAKENQLVGFKHLTFNFGEETANAKIQHGLGYLPQDVLITRITGTGKLTLNWPLFDATALDVSASGPCEVRMYVGTYAADQGNISSPLGASEVQAAVPSLVAATTTDDSGDTAPVQIDWSLFPAGMWLEWPGPVSTIPTGWAERDGRQLSATDYPVLFAIIGYGWGGSSGTFRLPDTRGYFLRHLDTGTTVDPDSATRTALYTGGNTGAKVGTYEADAYKVHYHGVPRGPNLAGGSVAMNQLYNLLSTTYAYDNTLQNIDGGAETRPKNAATIGIIKLK